MALDELKAIVRPPQRPSEVGDFAAWREIESKIGLILPSDYKGFVFTYGTGLFARFYRIYNPFSLSKFMALHPSIQRTCAGIGEIKRAWPAQVPYAIYPSVPGLLPWGNDENGNDYYWLTN
ncbi:MAG TPA: hypothetical protein VGI88_05385, partial [Verrucomicrobiae bacterium]